MAEVDRREWATDQIVKTICLFIYIAGVVSAFRVRCTSPVRLDGISVIDRNAVSHPHAKHSRIVVPRPTV